MTTAQAWLAVLVCAIFLFVSALLLAALNNTRWLWFWVPAALLLAVFLVMVILDTFVPKREQPGPELIEE